MRKKLVIFGHYGVPNWGDESILSGMLSQIDISKYSITVISHDPKFTKLQHNVKSVNAPPFGVRSFLSFSWIQTFKILKEADYIIFGGGGLWQAYPKKALQLWDWYLRCVLFFSSAPKIFCLGTSFGTVPKHFLTDEMKKRLQKIKYFSVRDEQSSEILKNQWGILPSKIEQTADSAFFLNTFSLGENIQKKENKQILISMREGDITIEEEKKIMKALQKKFKNYRFTFLVMQSFQANDEKFADRYSLEKIFPSSVDEILEKISQASFVVSSRLHTNILASVCGTPFCAISCREKTKNLFGEKFSIEKEKILETNFEKFFIEKIKKIITDEQGRNEFLELQKEKLEVFFPMVFQ